MQTVIRTYCLDIRLKADRAAYEALCDKLTAQGLKCFESPQSHYRKDLDKSLITLGAFSGGQWAVLDRPNLLVFDWAQDYQPNYSLTIKRGYYLDQTDEMRKARAGHIG